MPPTSVLCAPGDGGLDDDRVAELLGCGDGFVRVGGEPLGHERQAVGEQELARVRRASARRRRRSASARSTTRSAASRSMSSQAADGAVWLPEPLGALRQASERARRRLRVVEGGDVGAVAAKCDRNAVSAQDDGEHRLLARRCAAACVDRVRHLVGGGGHGRDEEDDRRVDVRIFEQERERRGIGRRGGACRACRQGSPRSPRRAEAGRGRSGSRRSSSGSVRPAASQASAQRIPSPPALVSTAHATTLRLRLVGEQGDDVDQLLE